MSAMNENNLRKQLGIYIDLDREADALETEDCHCADFFTCENCRRASEVRHQKGLIMQTWGNQFAYSLAERMGLIQTELEAL